MTKHFSLLFLSKGKQAEKWGSMNSLRLKYNSARWSTVTVRHSAGILNARHGGRRLIINFRMAGSAQRICRRTYCATCQHAHLLSAAQLRLARYIKVNRYSSRWRHAVPEETGENQGYSLCPFFFPVPREVKWYERNLSKKQSNKQFNSAEHY